MTPKVSMPHTLSILFDVSFLPPSLLASVSLPTCLPSTLPPVLPPTFSPSSLAEVERREIKGGRLVIREMGSNRR